MVCQILRLEDENGYGMYQENDDGATPAYEAFEYLPEWHPDPYDDLTLCRGAVALGKTLTDFFYAFVDAEQLINWVGNEVALIKLNEFGIKLAIYTCKEEDVIVSVHQTIFCDYIEKHQHNVLDYFKISLDTEH